MKTILPFFFTILFFDLYSQANAGLDTSVCQNNFVNIVGKGLSFNDTGFYTWRNIENNAIFSTNELLNFKSTVVGRKQFELKLEIYKNGNSYFSYDSVWIETLEIPMFSGFSTAPICFNDAPINLTSNSGLTVKIGKGHSVTYPADSIRFFDTLNPSWISGGPPFLLDYKKYLSRYVVPKNSLLYRPCYEYTDFNGCYNKECKTIRINPNPEVELKTGSFCQNSGFVRLDKLVVKPVINVGGIETFRCIKVPDSSGVNQEDIVWLDNTVIPKVYRLDPGLVCEDHKTGVYTIEYCFKDAITGCQSCDSMDIEILKSYEIGFKNIPDKCENSPINLDSFIFSSCNNKIIDTTDWKVVKFNNSSNQNDSLVKIAFIKSICNGNIFKAQKGLYGSYQLMVDINNSSCVSLKNPILENIYLNVIESPNLNIDLPDTVCDNEAPFKLINIEPQGMVGKWSGKSVYLDTFYPSVSQGDNFHFEDIDVSYTYTDNNQCTESIIKPIRVVKTPIFKINGELINNEKYSIRLSAKNQNIQNKFLDFNWNLGNDFKTDSVIDEYTYSDGGVKKIVLLAKNKEFNCYGKDSLYIDLGVLSVRNNNNPFFKIYPNPFNDIITLNNLEFSFAFFELFNNKGKSLLVLRLNDVNKIDLSFLNKGFYFCKITGVDKVYSYKLIKE